MQLRNVRLTSDNVSEMLQDRHGYHKSYNGLLNSAISDDLE